MYHEPSCKLDNVDIQIANNDDEYENITCIIIVHDDCACLIAAIAEAEAHARWLVNVHDGSIAVPGVTASEWAMSCLGFRATRSGALKLIEGTSPT